MIHWITNLFLMPVLRLFFRHLHYEGLENLPKDKPILLCANHPNSFLDGIVLSAFLKPETYVFVRGDVFKNKVANYYFRKLYLIPIFRSHDASARTALKMNNLTYDECFTLFQKGKRIMIFPESISRSEWKLRTLKKGAARIFLDMKERSEDLDLCIVPLGFNYSSFKGLRTDVVVHFEKPYFNADLNPQENTAKRITFITETLTHEISKSMILDHKDHPDLMRLGLDLVREEMKLSPWRIAYRGGKRFEDEKMVSEAFLSERKEVVQAAEAYQKELDKAKLTNSGFYSNTFGQWFWTVLASLPTFLIWLIWLPCIALGKFIADELVKQDHFYDSIRIGGIMAASLIWTVMIALVVGLTLGWVWAPLVFVLPFFITYHYSVREVLNRFVQRLKWQRALRNSSQLLETRTAFLQVLKGK
jgi:1-acyl-sn-glycerol-3-phosphate acyltransferase